MIVNIIDKNLSDIVNNLNHMKNDIDRNYKEWVKTRDNLLEEIEQLDNKKNSLMNDHKSKEDITAKKESDLNCKESDLNKREQRVLEMEGNLRKEIEEERKVSILKNIQLQLKDKTSENELLLKQLNFYKRNSELFHQLVLKYKLNSENLTVNLIEESILKFSKKDTFDEMVVEPTPLPAPKVEPLPKVESIPKVEPLPVPAPKVEPVPVPKVEPLPKVEPDEEGIVVEDFEYRGVLYYIDNTTGDIYARYENDDVGDLVGNRDIKGKVKFLKKK